MTFMESMALKAVKRFGVDRFLNSRYGALMTSIRAKASVYSVTDYGASEQTKLSGVASGKPEDNTFAVATPSLSIDITIDNPTAKGFLKPGKNYYVDFTEAPE